MLLFEARLQVGLKVVCPSLTWHNHPGGGESRMTKTVAAADVHLAWTRNLFLFSSNSLAHAETSLGAGSGA